MDSTQQEALPQSSLLAPPATYLVSAARQARVPLCQDTLHPEEERPLYLVL